MFEIKKSKNGQFYFVLKGKNGEVIVTSETYTAKQSCKKGIGIVKKSLFATVVDNSDIPIRNEKGQFNKR